MGRWVWTRLDRWASRTTGSPWIKRWTSCSTAVTSMRARPFARQTASPLAIPRSLTGMVVRPFMAIRACKLLENNGRGVVYEYYRKTGFFHVNHNVIVQNRILKDHPWAALELFNAFQRSKEVAYERARRAQSAYLYFPGKDFQEQAASWGRTRIPSASVPWGKISNVLSRAPWSKGYSANPCGSRMFTLGRR